MSLTEKFLIVNADDYGYSASICRGILASTRNGIVRATGVMANARGLSEYANWLRDCEQLDVGVHLNLTQGEPLTSVMRRKLTDTDHRFPSKSSMVRRILSGAITENEIRSEWGAQVQGCFDLGFKPLFLNSHEHLHMLPSLFIVAKDLARQFEIPHVRFVRASLGESNSPMSLARNLIMMSLGAFIPGSDPQRHMIFLGLGSSGKLKFTDLQRMISDMKPGCVYELMCHPGELSGDDSFDERIRAYHDWLGELHALTDPETRSLIYSNNVRLIGYRHLRVQRGRLVVLPEVQNAD